MEGRIYRPEQGTSMLELPEVGRIHIGVKNERGLPTSIDWFRPTGKYAGMFTRALGEKPQMLQVIFPDDDPTKVCNERFEYRDDKGALVARGDGRNFEVWNGKKYVTCTIEQKPDFMNQVVANFPTKRGADNWDIVLTLRFIVPAVRGVVGVWQITTKGAASSIRNIRESFDAVQVMRGTVTQTVFDLSVQFAKSNKPNTNSRYPVLSLVANDTRLDEIRKMLQPENSVGNLLLSE